MKLFATISFRCEDLPPIEYDKEKKEDITKEKRREDPIYESPIQDEPPSGHVSVNVQPAEQLSQQDKTGQYEESNAVGADPSGNMGETVYGTEYTDPKQWYDDYLSKFSTDTDTQPHYHTDERDLNPQPDDGSIYNDPHAYYPPPTSPEPSLNEDGSKLDNDVYYSRTYGTYMTYEGDKPVHFYTDSSLSVDSDVDAGSSSTDGYTGGAITTLNDVSGLVEYNGASQSEHYFVYDDKPDGSHPSEGGYGVQDVEQTDSYVKTEAEAGKAHDAAPVGHYQPHYWPQPHWGWRYPWWYGRQWWAPTWWPQYIQHASQEANREQNQQQPQQQEGVILNQYEQPEAESRTTREPQQTQHGTIYYGATAALTDIPTRTHSYEVQALEDPGTSGSSGGIRTSSGTIYYGSTGQNTVIPTERHSYEVDTTDLGYPPSFEPGIHDQQPKKSHYTPPKKSHPPPPKKSHPPPLKKSHPPPPKKSHYQPPAKSHPPPKSHPPAPKKSHPPPPKKSHYQPPAKSHPPPKKSHDPPPKSHPAPKSHPQPKKSHPPPKSFPHPKKNPPHPKKNPPHPKKNPPPKKNGEDSGYTPTVRQEGLSYSLGGNLHVMGNTLIHTGTSAEGGSITNYVGVCC